MLALAVGLNLWGKKLKGQLVNASILAKSDSMVTVHATETGDARSRNIAFVLREIAGAVLGLEVGFEVSHVPGVSNFIADAPRASM